MSARPRQVPNRMVWFTGTGTWYSLVALVGKAEQRQKKEGTVGDREASKDKKPTLKSEELGFS